MKEIETKILEVDKDRIAAKLDSLGAEKIQDTKLTVDWFRPKDIQGNDDPWYLRIRSTSDGKTEVTWKSKPNFVGISKQVKEINFPVKSAEQMADFFESIGLVRYAHQEKFRTSWKYQNYRFDLDQYPEMPAYLEIEGESEEQLHQAIALMGLEGHKAVSEGERTLIEREYKLNWHAMKFA